MLTLNTFRIIPINCLIRSFYKCLRIFEAERLGERKYIIAILSPIIKDKTKKKTSAKFIPFS